MAGSCTGQQPYHASIREGRELDCKGELRFTGQYNFPLSAGSRSPFFQANDCQFNGSGQYTVFNVFMPSCVILDAKYHVYFSKIHTTNYSDTCKSGTVTLMVDKISVQPPLSTAWQDCNMQGDTMRIVLNTSLPIGYLTVPGWIMLLSAAHAQITKLVKKRKTDASKKTIQPDSSAAQHSGVSAATNAVLTQAGSNLAWLLHETPFTAAVYSGQGDGLPETEGDMLWVDGVWA